SGNSITGTLTNPTNTPQTATYTVTPTSGGCQGPDFTLTVTVNPGPNISDITENVCSEENFNITPINGTNGIVPAGTTYIWGAPTVTGGLTGGTAGSGNSITGTLTNPTNSTQTATYEVTPSSGTCSDETFTVTVTVSPKADVTDMTETVCSGDLFTVTPTDGIDGIIPAGTTYSWDAPVISAGLTGGVSGSGNNISGTLTNTTSSSQTATYTVTPTSNGCVGPDFTVTVTVDPIATIDDLTLDICTGDSFSLTPTDGVDGIVPAGTTYDWVLSSVTGGLTGGSDDSGNSITGTLTNPTNTPQTATYTVTPTSGGCQGPDFTLTVTVNPITAITVQPDTTGDVECFGDGFDIPLTINAVGGDLTYQWYAKPDNSDIAANPGTIVPGATSSSFTPPSTPEGINYYYVVVTGFCGTVVSELSGEYRVNPPITVIDINPSTAEETTCQGGSFPDLNILASGEGDVSYQWYSNTAPSNSGGTLIPGATDPNFTPSSSAVGTLYYYATASSNCGTVPTSVSGAFIVTPLTEITDEDLNAQTVCDGSNLNPLSITATGTGTLSYQWYQNDQNSTTTGNITAIGTNSETFTPPAVLGTYYYFVVVQSDCGPDDISSVSGPITVNPIPTVTNTNLEQTICYGENISEVILTSAVSGTTFSWTATASAGITGHSTSGAGNIPIQTLSNSEQTQGSVVFTITPSANGCVGPAINYTVYVDPLPEVSNTSLTQTICSGDNTTQVDLNSTVAGTTFSWTASATNGISGFAASGTGPIPVQTISNSGDSPGTVTYEITPTANSCNGPIATYTVQVNPIPTVTNTNTDQTICSGGTSTQVDFTSSVNGTTFDWIVTSSSGVSGFAPSGTGALLPQTISTTGPTQGFVTFEITPISNGCSGPPLDYTIYVNPTPTVTNTILEQTICSGENTSQVDLTSDVLNTTFSWTASGSSDVSGFATSGTGPIPVETIINSGSSQGTVTYTITPLANGCSGPFATYIVKVDPLPVPTFTSSPGIEICAEIEEVTYTTQSGQANYTWSIPGVAGTDYTITAGGISSSDHTVSIIWLSDGSKTVEVSYSNGSTGCSAASPASSTTDVEALATVGPTSNSFPSVCISSPILQTFTQPTTGVTSIGTPTGLPLGVSANFDASTGLIEFSGDVTGAVPGLYSYSIPLNGNCISGLEATGTIDVTPTYQLTSISAVSATTTGGQARIIINGNPTTLPNGQYIVTYELDDGTPPPTEETSAPFSVTDGRGVFPTIPLTNLDVDVYTITVKSIQKVTDVCDIPLTQNNVAYFSVCGATFDQDGTFYVPAGIYEITIQATGGGTSGQTDLVTIPVTPGEVLGIFIGEGGGTGAERDTYITRDSSDPDPLSTSLIYVTGGGGPGTNGEVIISYSCPDPNDNDCFEIIDDGAKSGETVIRFNCNDSWEIPEGLVEFSIFAVGGGGGGGMGPTAGGGGGGGINSTTVTSTDPYGISSGNSINIQVGQGGNGASTVNVKGGNGGSTTVTSSISDPNGPISISLTALGGGGGGSFNNLNGADGASGGGGAYSDQALDTPGIGGAGIPGQGNSGGNGGRGQQSNHARGGGGGGGAGLSGGPGGGAGVGQSKAGDGGEGSSFVLGGVTQGYGAGGGGIGFNFNGEPNTPGLGGEVNGVILGGTAADNGPGSDGTIFTGSGGGAGTLGGGNGGSGVVYITYLNFKILQVEYLYFEAKFDEVNRNGQLSWATSKEWANARFEIERSIGNADNWEKIGEVAGQGYKDSQTDYTFTDTQLPAYGGNIFYRLKQVDFEDTFTYSVTRAIQVPSLKGESNWIIYPNPSELRSNVTVGLINPSNYQDEPIIVRISDVRGINVSYSANSVEEVNQAVNSYLETAISGMHIVQLIWGDQSEQLKLIRK
ncbi:T9SS type A sorting domain-containing protein, partial [Algoriphagus lutimaris]|uniref:beta strand repeat-containing protein n=1 Tax=Algoriphagus lutimaris TaxID=613197 RepID=UPI00196B86E0